MSFAFAFALKIVAYTERLEEHKFKIAAKEADETEYWLLLCKYSENYPFEESLLEEIKEIQKIINSIINTSKKQISLSYNEMAHWHIFSLAY